MAKQKQVTEILKELLEKSGYTQAQVSRRIGMDSRSLNRIFQGDVPVTLETSIKLSYVFGIKSDYLYYLQCKQEVIASRLIFKENASKQLNYSLGKYKNDCLDLLSSSKKEDIDISERLFDLLKYLKVADLSCLADVKPFKGIYKNPNVKQLDKAMLSIFFAKRFEYCHDYFKGYLKTEDGKKFSYIRLDKAIEKVSLYTFRVRDFLDANIIISPMENELPNGAKGFVFWLSDNYVSLSLPKPDKAIPIQESVSKILDFVDVSKKSDIMVIDFDVWE